MHQESVLHICNFLILRILHRWIHTLCKLLMLLFFPSPSMIPLMSFQLVYFIVYSFFYHYYPWYEWTSVYLTNLPLKDIWIISSLGLLQIKILCTFMKGFSWTCFPFSGKSPENEFLVVCWATHLSFVRNCHAPEGLYHFVFLFTKCEWFSFSASLQAFGIVIYYF